MQQAVATRLHASDRPLAASPRRRPLAMALAAVIAIAATAVAPAPAGAAEAPRDAKPNAGAKVDFNAQVRPILSDKCFHCHGPDAGRRKAGLRLDTKAGAFAALESEGRAIVPGKPDESEMIARIRSEDEAERMPPKSLGRELSPEEAKTLERWIAQGAEWKEHWAFLPPADAATIAGEAPGATAQAGWARNGIDRLVLRRLEAEGLSPSPEATKERLIRRATFDLTGLPPTPAEVDDFLADARPDSYERLVDRLLASPRFGERMAVDWLDVARYADTFGYQADVYRATWPWRDWVVKSFNDDMPFDRFITWQLAGDLLPDPTPEQVLATAFNRHHRQTNEGGSIEEEWRLEYVADRTITFGAAFLGLTLECARCHDHKYDPITQKDFYSLSAFFNSIDESGLYSHFTTAMPTPTMLLADEARRTAIAAAERKIAAAEAEVDRLGRSRNEAFEAWLRKAAGKGGSKTPPTLPDRIGAFPLDAIANGTAANLEDPSKPAKLAEGPELVPGKVGKALRLSGENGVTLPMGNFDRFEPFSVSLWLQTPDKKDRAVVLHRSMAWTDAGSRGYEVLIEDGRLAAHLVHFWPGNALGIRTKAELPIGRWVHVAMAYDGSSRAAGLRLYVDGRPADCEVVRDALTKNITGGGGDDIAIGQRFRDRGFKNGLVDDVSVFRRAITRVEAAQLHDPATLPGLLSRDPSSYTPDERRDLLAFYLSAEDPESRKALASLSATRKERSDLVDPVAEIMVMKELPRPRPTFVLKRGAYDAPGEPVARDTPAALPRFAPGWPRDRLGLARWLTDPKQPLTARVTINRWWQSIFGRGIVATPEDFGSQGQLPSHPELLDWLARTFVDSGWDVKGLWRLIVTSATYRQASEASPERLARDPDNVLLSRGPRLRLPAEMIRDNALAASGLLVGKLGGPPVKPFQPEGLWKEKANLEYVRDVGEGSHRRSLYTFWKRTSPPPSMLTFDATSREVCAVKRLPTATPLQALVLLNDPQYVEAAKALAERAAREAGPDVADRAAFVFRSLAGRRPDGREAAVLAALYREQYDEFRSGRSDPAKLLAVGDAPPDASRDPAELAALTVLAQAVMNFDETVMKR
ncbi:Planctomycete cytochrome C [Aquisphaera giovannonii]|uniref:Planctomycete cytochrome C n=1 Tax=Aquisphaera giovannonii TaxID=406548 RepID=A0A5B9WG07_9BACT|nr:DUF1553 domain-containing protein [Aquisphaera giovannonii]QEH38945.1 Planctomycete cytochrome C [Aquisphaera giovannonii]